MLADLYHALTSNEIFLIDEGVITLRDSAWTFATILALEPGIAHPATIWARDQKVSAQAELIYDPPGLIGLLKEIVASIAARESRDVVTNIRKLNEIAATPATIKMI